MATATLFQRLIRRSEKDLRKAATTFDELVSQTLDNEKGVDETQAAKILEAARKTPDDLQAAVDLLAQRRTWAATIEEANGASKRLVDIELRLTAMNAEQAEARQRWASEETELSNERNALLAVSAGATTAEVKLRESCPAEMKAEDRGLSEQKRKLLAKRRKLLQQLNLPANGLRDTSADLRALKQKREYVLRRQKEGVVESGNRNLLGDVKPLADQLRDVDAKIAAETKRIAPVWKTIEGFNKQIAKLDIESKKLTAEKLEV